jgi:hypothetical protein
VNLLDRLRDARPAPAEHDPAHPDAQEVWGATASPHTENWQLVGREEGPLDYLAPGARLTSRPGLQSAVGDVPAADPSGEVV